MWKYISLVTHSNLRANHKIFLTRDQQCIHEVMYLHSTSWRIKYQWSRGLNNYKSALIQIVTWSQQAICHYLNWTWPKLTLKWNVVTMPQSCCIPSVTNHNPYHYIYQEAKHNPNSVSHYNSCNYVHPVLAGTRPVTSCVTENCLGTCY